MEEIFKGFHNPSDQALIEAWSDDDSLFIFDTNVFLNLYSYADQTRDDFFNVLNKLNDKVWIPYHVGLEYQFRRLKVIKNEKSVFNDLRKSLSKIEKIFDDDIKKLSLEKRFPKLHENTEKLHKDIVKGITAYKKSVTYWDEKQPCVRSHDTIRAKINKIFTNKVGKPPENQEILDKLYEDGEARYEKKIPPGYEDSSKANHESPHYYYNSLKYERRFGDLIIWKQIIDKAKDSGIKKVIFITDDSKEDWWYILDSRGKKKIGPHAHLQCEIFEETDIELFFMYNTSSFLEDGKVNLEIGVHESSIKDANSRFWKKELTHTFLSNNEANDLTKLQKEYSKQLKQISDFENFKKIHKNKDLYIEDLQRAEEYLKENKDLLKELSKNDLYRINFEKDLLKSWHTTNYQDSELSKVKEMYKKMQILNFLKNKPDDDK